MKKITLDDIEQSLTAMQPVISVPRDISLAAKKALDKMLAMS